MASPRPVTRRVPLILIGVGSGLLLAALPLLARSLVPYLQSRGPPRPPPPSPSPTPACGPPTRIIIPSLGIDAPVVPTDLGTGAVDGSIQPVWQVVPPDRAGWHRGSAELGRPGNTVINGHNWPQNAVFCDLYQIQPGARLILYSDETPFVYQVTDVLLLQEAGQPLSVRQENARYILPTEDERVTLVTCHPYGSLEYRLIVIARPAETPFPSTGK